MNNSNTKTSYIIEAEVAIVVVVTVVVTPTLGLKRFLLGVYLLVYLRRSLSNTLRGLVG